MPELMALTISIEDPDRYHQLDIDDIHIAQGDLKSLSDDDYHALRFGLEDFGYCEPIVVWRDPAGKYHCGDGTQRLHVLKAMRSDNWFIPRIPVILLRAQDRKDFLKKLALLAGNYGKATVESVSNFAIQNELDFDFMKKYTSLADFKTGDEALEDALKQDPEPVKTVCPNCNFEF